MSSQRGPFLITQSKWISILLFIPLILNYFLELIIYYFIIQLFLYLHLYIFKFYLPRNKLFERRYFKGVEFFPRLFNTIFLFLRITLGTSWHSKNICWVMNAWVEEDSQLVDWFEAMLFWVIVCNIKCNLLNKL